MNYKEKDLVKDALIEYNKCKNTIANINLKINSTKDAESVHKLEISLSFTNRLAFAYSEFVHDYSGFEPEELMRYDCGKLSFTFEEVLPCNGSKDEYYSKEQYLELIEKYEEEMRLSYQEECFKC